MKTDYTLACLYDEYPSLVKNKKIYAQSGAGIVFDSIAKNEHSECINKANALFEAYKLAHQI